VIAVAHALLVIAYCVLTRCQPYRKREEEAAKQRHRQRSITYHMRCLAKLVAPIPALPSTEPPKGIAPEHVQ
jgi:hypothetical protein